MVLRKLSQTLRITLALMVATFSSGLLQPAVAYATHSNGNSGHSGGNEACPDGTTQLAKYNFVGGSYIAESGGTDVTVTGTAASGSFTVVKANTTVSAVVVKGATDAKTMYYQNVTNGNFDNIGLVNGGENVPAISNVKICGNTTVPTNTPVTAGVVTYSDVCGTEDDTYTVPTTANVTYSVEADTYSGTGMVNVTATANEGYVLTAPYSFSHTFTNEACLSPSICENPANGGVITQNTAGWNLYGDAEFVNDGIALGSNGWSGSYVENTNDYSVSDALQLDWTYEGTVSGAHGIAIIFETADGDYIHYEPEPYSDDFWTTANGILPANGGGQGGPYSGSLQDILDTAGDLTIINTYFYFTSSSTNDIVLKSLSFNCATYTFDKYEVVEDRKIEICHATSAVVNPYNKIEVSISAADGGGDSGDHYNEHTGAIFDPETNENGDNWGDIIPPVGTHTGLNWTTEGQAIYNNGCNIPDENEGTPDLSFDYNDICTEDNDGSLIAYIDNDGTAAANDLMVQLYDDENNLLDTQTVDVSADNDVEVEFNNLAEGTYTVKVYNGVNLLSSQELEVDECGGGGGGVDVCPNVTGIQLVIPNGLVKDDNGNCVTDQCPLVPGVQTNMILCPAGQGGGSPTTPTPGQTLGTSTTTTPVATAVQNAVLPAVLPATGGVDSPFMILVASMLAFGATYFLQGKRLLGRREALEA